MELPKLTRNQWVAVSIAVILGVIFSLTFTSWWEGQAIEVSVENAGTKPIFAYIDNTGRHGDSTLVENLQMTDGKRTPSGLTIRPTQTRSFGTAVGLGDSPTLHVLPITEDLRADAALTNDCVFDTLALKFELPARHIKIKWTGNGCEIDQ